MKSLMHSFYTAAARAGVMDIDHALTKAALRGNASKIRTLVEAGASFGDQDHKNDLLRIAAGNGHAEVVSMLLAAGADVHTHEEEPLRSAAEYGHTEIVKALLTVGADANVKSPLWLAATNGHTEVVKALLEAGADVHAGNDAAIRWAKYQHRGETVRVLLDHGADPQIEGITCCTLRRHKPEI